MKHRFPVSHFFLFRSALPMGLLAMSLSLLSCSKKEGADLDSELLTEAAD